MLRTVHEHAAASGDDSLHLLQQAVRLQVVHRFAQAFIALRELVGGHAAVRLAIVELILALQRPLVVAGEVLAARQQAGRAHLLCRVLRLRSQDVRVSLSASDRRRMGSGGCAQSRGPCTSAAGGAACAAGPSTSPCTASVREARGGSRERAAHLCHP